MMEILLAVLVFTGVVLLLALLILAARAWLLPSGEVLLRINEEPGVPAQAGGRLLDALGDGGLFLPQACGGKGTCGLCRVRVLSGGGPLLPVERERIPRQAAAHGERLACQVTLRQDVHVELPAEVLGVQQFRATVRTARQLAPLLKEIVLDLPSDQTMDFSAGAFVQVTCPAFQLCYRDLDVPEAYRSEWARMGLPALEAAAAEPVTRAYSLANYPGEGHIVMLLVRLAIPPPGASPDIPPGKVSSWLYGLRPGEEVLLSGPHGHFFAEESEREMVLLGGGAGMAPMRSHILAQLQAPGSHRTLSFWYGARSRTDLVYADLFEQLAREHERFRWTPALSEPRAEDEWTGAVGFIHQVAYDTYLSKHPAPEECVYYLCGPPVMLAATLRMLDSLGVERENIFCDDFGS
jgi:Na+-transporting NADH:ubiquinone oxidoreductase subunit F